MTTPVTLARIIVGSRLQGLALPDSDTDVRRVWISPLGAILSPWRTDGPELEPAEDGWELRHFLGLLAKGNPTVLEVVHSDMILSEPDRRWDRLRALAPRLLDPAIVHGAFKGYAASHQVHVERERDRAVDPTTRTVAERRLRKQAVTALRVVHQGTTLLRDGVFIPRVTEDRDMLMAIRTEGLTPPLLAIWRERLDSAVADLDTAAAAPHPTLTLDREAAIAFLVDAYSID